MDNSYYTGATLIRASGGGGLKYPPNLPLAGTPLLMQCPPNILTGAPLIRKGQQTTNGPGQGPGPPPAPPGIICCFQPIYYIPAPGHNGGGPMGPGPGPITFINNNNKHKPLAISPPLHQHQQQHHQQPPKRKNYKTLQKLKPVKSNSNEESGKSSGSFGMMEVYRKSSVPDPISPPAKTVALTRPRRDSYSSSSPTSSTSASASSSTVNSPTHFFTSSIESTKECSSEEKQRNEKLLNFYFYEEHWRPKECDELQNSSNHQIGHESWEIRQKEQQEEQVQNFKYCATSVKNSATMTLPSAVGRNNHHRQQKDLEVEAQIVTLANGHRDLEIRLCYVTS